MRTNALPMILLLAAALCACSAGDRVSPERKGQPDLSASLAGSGSGAGLISPLQSSLEEEGGTGACARLEELGGQPDLSGAGRFSYLAKVAYSPGWTGALAIGESPLAQFILGEAFEVPDWDSFYAQAKKEHEAGRVGGMQWLLLNMMNMVGLGKVAELSALNDKLSAAFPGIFGSPGSLESSLHWQIARRAAKVDSLERQAVAATLSRSLPLFPGNGQWEAFTDSARLSMAAALRGFRQKTDEREKLCSLVLLHQSFAQLLRLKGYLSPELKPGQGGAAAGLARLSAEHPAFAKTEVPGAFFDLALQRQVRLKSEDILGYDPGARLITVTSRVPAPGEAVEPGVLSDSLAFMELLLYSYEMSSPASPWVADTGYPFGDIQNPGAHAILPAEAHQLSLGLLVMHFKNLAAVHVQKVGATGARVRDGEAPAGIALVVDPDARTVARVRLGDVMRLARIVSYFENALLRLKGRPASAWQSMNPVYDARTLAALLGKEMLPEQEPARPQPAGVPSAGLVDNLRALKLPLALLLSQLGTGRAGCFSEVEWNMATGRIDPVTGCSREQKLRLADTFELLARGARSPLLLKKAEELRR